MKESGALFVLIVVGLPAVLYAQQGSMAGTQATASAGWSARGRHTSVVFSNEMWVMGGSYYDGNWVLLNDVWHSTDGVTWTQATAHAGWSARLYPSTVVFDNKMWVIGGGDGGRPAERNDVWYSTDGANWICACSSASWPARSCHTSLVFDNKIWVIGGYNGASGTNDVWYSDDGIVWTQATAHASWSGRHSHTSVVFDNKMWVIGGYNGDVSDVWYSADGVTWIQATADAGWVARNCHTSVVFDDKLWLINGYNYGYQQKDVWYSANGADWTRATDSTQWAGRYYHTSVVYQDRIWIMGGYDLNYSYVSDVWYSGGNILTTLTPNGGEVWSGGSSNSTRWRTIGAGFMRYRLLLSTNGGLSYPDTIAHTVSPSDTTYNWTIPLINSATCRVMVQALDSTGAVVVQDASDSDFAVVTTGVEEVPVSNISNAVLQLYPNPARTYFAIRLPSTTDRSTVEIYDVLGKLVEKKTLAVPRNGDRVGISLEGVENGIYFVRVGNEAMRGRLVIAR